MPGILKHSAGILLQGLYIPLSGGTVQHSRLTETAPADTAPLNLQYHTVLGDLDKRNHRSHGVIGIRKVCNHLLLDRLLRMGIRRRKRGDRSVLLIFCPIELRNIDSFDLCCFLQVVLSGTTMLLVLLICIKKLIVNRLPFSDVEHIKKVSQRFRVIGAGSASDHNRIGFRSVACIQGNAA